VSEVEDSEVEEVVIDTSAKYIFLDTSIYHAHSFDTASATFGALQSLCDRNEVRVIVTDVVRGEVRSGVAEQVGIAAEVLSSKHRQLKILDIGRHLLTGDTLQIDQTSVADGVLTKLESYWTNCKAVHLDSQAVSVPEMLNSYFRRDPPFGSGKKKHEFPDAINVAMLRQFARTSSAKIHVVTGDQDLITCCSPDGSLLHAPSLAKLISAFADRIVSARIASAITRSEHMIFELLIDSIDDHIFDVDAIDYDIINSSFIDEHLDSVNILMAEGTYFTAEVGFSMLLELEIEYRPWDEPTLEEEFRSPRFRRASVARRLDLWGEVSGGWSPFDDEIEVERVVHSFPQSVAINLISQDLPARSGFRPRDRVFHIKFGYGVVKEVDDTKLTVEFEKAGEKKVIDSFVEKQ
jgi:hypothetical protein